MNKKLSLFAVLMSMSCALFGLHYERYGVEVTLKQVSSMSYNNNYVVLLTVSNFSDDYVHIYPQKIANAVDVGAFKYYITKQEYAQAASLLDVIGYALWYSIIDWATKGSVVESPAKIALGAQFALKVVSNVQCARSHFKLHTMGHLLEGFEDVRPQQTKHFLVPFKNRYQLDEYEIMINRIVTKSGSFIEIIVD